MELLVAYNSAPEGNRRQPLAKLVAEFGRIPEADREQVRAAATAFFGSQPVAERDAELSGPVQTALLNRNRQQLIAPRAWQTRDLLARSQRGEKVDNPS
jgi:hypothetical protein